MSDYLVIVESPAKAKTIEKYLGKKYKVKASMGHVRDLPKSQMGVDVEHNFEPKYITIRGKGPVLKEIKTAAKKDQKNLSRGRSRSRRRSNCLAFSSLVGYRYPFRLSSSVQ